MNIYTMILALMIGASCTAWAAPQVTTAQKVQKGNELFAGGGIDAAQQAYADAQVDAPESAEVCFNLGATFYRQKKYDRALELYTKSLENASPMLEAKAHYNSGNTLVQQGKLKEALESYKRCLKLDSTDEDAKYNIEYLQRKIKEMASTQKDEQEKDPLQKLLRELEKLINLHAATTVQTKDLADTAATSNAPDMTAMVTVVRTNEERHAERSVEIQDGFRALTTNLPPEKLNSTGAAPQGQAEPAAQPDDRTRELGSMFQALVSAAKQVSQPQTGAVTTATAGTLDAVAEYIAQIEKSTKDDLNKQFAGQAKSSLQSIRTAFEDTPPAMKVDAIQTASTEFNSLMKAIQDELRPRIDKLQGGAATNAPQKTLGQKIANAIVFMGDAHTTIVAAAKMLATTEHAAWTNALPNQDKGLENLIKARKEFDDDKQNQQQQQQQQQEKNDKNDKDKKDQKDQKDKNKEKNKDQQQQQNQQQNQQQKDDQNKDQQQNQQPKPQQMDKEQAERLLRDFDEDQRKREKARKEQMQGTGYERVDKDW